MWLPNKLEIIGGLIGLIGVLGLCLYTQDLKIHELKQTAVVVEATYRQAQADAQSLALNEKIRIEKENEERSKKADQSYAELSTKYRTVLLRYASAQSSASATLTAALNKTPEGINGSSTSTELLTISLADAKICSDNTARLEIAHQWALGLK